MHMVGLMVLAFVLAAFVSDGDDFDRAWDAAAEGRYQTAAHHYTAAIESGGLSRQDRSVAYNNRGVAWARLGQFDRALTDFSAALSMAPGDSILFSNIQHARRPLVGESQAPKFEERKRTGSFWFM